jgi:hypothetical protein
LHLNTFFGQLSLEWIYAGDKIAAEKMTEESTESIEVDSQSAEKAVI